MCLLHPGAPAHCIHSDFDIHALERLPCSLDGVVNRNIVFQRVCPSDVIVIPIFPSPDDATRLIFLTGNQLEFNFDETVSQ